MTEEAKKGRGCFFYGCLGLIVVVFLGIAGIYFGTRYALKKLADTYTSAQAVPIAPPALPMDEADRSAKRVESFVTSLNSGKAAAPLALSGDEFDFLIRNAPEAAGMSNHFRVQVEGNELKADISIPLEKMQVSFLPGRFLNGSATFNLELANGSIGAQLKGITVNGLKVPDDFLAGLRAQDLRWTPTGKAADLLKLLENIEVKDGRILLHPKNKLQPI